MLYRWKPLKVSVKFYEYDRPPINRRRIINMAFGGGEIGEIEMNNLTERNQQPYVTKVTFYSSSDL